MQGATAIVRRHGVYVCYIMLYIYIGTHTHTHSHTHTHIRTLVFCNQIWNTWWIPHAPMEMVLIMVHTVIWLHSWLWQEPWFRYADTKAYWQGRVRTFLSSNLWSCTRSLTWQGDKVTLTGRRHTSWLQKLRKDGCWVFSPNSWCW